MLKSFFPRVFGLLLIILSVSFLWSCELSQNYLKQDRENSMEPQDYRDAFAPRPVDVDEKSGRREDSKIPPLQSYVAKPGATYKPMPLVSVSVNQTVPVRDVIYEIAEQAQYDVQLDPRITGSIIFSARNRPLDSVIDRIAEIAGLRYSFDDDVLHIEVDTPYHKTYKVNYLSLTRTTQSSINNDISVVDGEGATTGSDFSANNASDINFWGELETNLQQLLLSNENNRQLTTSDDPQVTVAEQNPTNIDPIIMDEQGNITDVGPNVEVQAPEAVINVNTIPSDNNEVDPNEEDPFAARFSINRQAGLISVYATDRLHKEIDEYLTEVKKAVNSQVLIEAKVLEVSLNDEFAAGIDWGALFGDRGGVSFGPFDLADNGAVTLGTTGLVRGLLEADDSIRSTGLLNYQRGDFGVRVDALSRFGTVQALSSPRLTVLNNQSAVLNVSENVVYFEIDVDLAIDDNGNPVRSFDTDAQTVPEGVLINVQPAINLDTQEISLALRPTITNIVGFTNDPNPDLATANVESPVPNVNVQEFDSIIKMSSGQTVVMGGLMQDRVSSTRNKVPVLGETPLLGSLFRNQEDGIEKTELVVFLRATIVEDMDTIHNTDKDLYRTFSSDRRPLRF